MYVRGSCCVSPATIDLSEVLPLHKESGKTLNDKPLLLMKICAHFTHYCVYLISFIYVQHIPSKDFGAEVRGSLDIVNYLDEVNILLDLSFSNVDTIIEYMLQQMLQGELSSNIEEVKDVFFMEDGNFGPK